MKSSRRQLRVLMTSDAVGGVWTYCLNLARATRVYGFQYLLAVMGPSPDASQLECAKRLANVKVESSNFALEWMPTPWRQVDAAGEWLLGLEQQHAPDIVHLNGYCHGSLPFHAPKVVVGHSCCLTWVRAVHDCEPPEAMSEYRARVSRGIAAASSLVAPTNAMLALYRQTYQHLPASQVIYNGAPQSTYLGGTHDKEPIVLCAGRAWDPAKNIECVAAAAADITWPIQLAGDLNGPCGSAALPEVTSLGRLSQKDMNAALRAASIYVHPAKYEPFGLLPLEAAQQHCALVLSDIPTLRELWDGAALFFNPESPPDLARVVNSLIHEPHCRAHLAALAHRRARRYSLTSFGRAYARLYRDLLQTQSDSGTRSPQRSQPGSENACASLSSITRS